MSWKPNSARPAQPSITSNDGSDSLFRAPSTSRNRSSPPSISATSALNSLSQHVQLESDTASGTSMRSVKTERSRATTRQETSKETSISEMDLKGKGKEVQDNSDSKRQRRNSPKKDNNPVDSNSTLSENGLPLSRSRSMTKKQSWFATKESPPTFLPISHLSTSQSSLTLKQASHSSFKQAEVATISSTEARTAVNIPTPTPVPSETSPTMTASDNSYRSWISTFSLSRTAVERPSPPRIETATPSQIIKAEAEAMEITPPSIKSTDSVNNVSMEVEEDPGATLKARGAVLDDSTITPRPNRVQVPSIQRASWWTWGSEVISEPVVEEAEVEELVVAEMVVEEEVLEPTGIEESIEPLLKASWLQSFWSDHSQAPITLPSNSSVVSSSASTKSAVSVETNQETLFSPSTPPKGSYHTLKNKASWALFPRSNATTPKPAPVDLPLEESIPILALEARGRVINGTKPNNLFSKSPGLGLASTTASSRASSRSRNNISTPNSPLLAPQADAPLKPLTGSLRSSSSLHARQEEEAKIENYVLPSFEDSFLRGPRAAPPRSGGLTRTVGAVSAYFFSQPMKIPPQISSISGEVGSRLPKSFQIMDGKSLPKIKSGLKIVVLGIGGWTPNPSLKVVFGEPTGTSKKFVEQMSDSVQQYLEDKNVESFNIQDIVLQADGIVQDRVDKLYEQLMSRPEAMEALRAADQIFIATHSQGCIVSTHLLAKLIEQGHCAGSRLMLLALCAISQGPFTYLSNSYTLSPYFNYLESASARELFHYQDPNSESSQLFLISLRTILASGVKITAVGSLNDQVVPLYSALWAGIDSVNFIRAIYIDSSAFRTSDFLANLVVFACRLRNSGLKDHDLIYHLSESLAGALSGVGHSKLYDDPDVFNLAVRYQFETTQLFDPPTSLNALGPPAPLAMSFNPQERRNPYLLTWSLRGIVEDLEVRDLFAAELGILREAFETWHPTTKVLKDVKLKLEGIRMLPRISKKEGKL